MNTPQSQQKEDLKKDFLKRRKKHDKTDRAKEAVDRIVNLRNKGSTSALRPNQQKSTPTTPPSRGGLIPGSIQQNLPVENIHISGGQSP